MQLIEKIKENDYLNDRLSILDKDYSDIEYKTLTIDKADGEIKFIMSAEVIDRDGDIIRLNGLNLMQFMKNPIMFYMHNSYESIGFWRDLRYEGNSLVGTPVFSDTAKAQEIKKQVEDGSLRAASIGFVVLESQLINIDGKQVNEITKSELFECSIVTIPANQDAIRIKDYFKEVKMEKLQELEKTIEELKSKNEELSNELETKAGRPLSKANEKKLRSAAESILDVLKSVDTMDEEEEEKANRLEVLEVEIAELTEKIQKLTDNKIKFDDYIGANNE